MRSRLKLRLLGLAPVVSILIVEDVARDADVLSSSLRLLFGPDLAIVHVRMIRAISKAIAEARPDIIFLDDRLSDGGSAETSLELVRAAGYRRPVVVLSGLLTRSRLIELSRLGVADVVHKDDANAVRLAEAVLKVLESPEAKATTKPKSRPAN